MDIPTQYSDRLDQDADLDQYLIESSVGSSRV